MKKMLSVLLCIILLFSLTACGQADGVTSFEKGKDDREKVEGLVLNGDVAVAENGVVTLPDDLKKLSDTGECIITEFQEQSAIYFFTFRGILGESKGYVYVTDQIDWHDYVNEDEYVGTMDRTDIEELGTNWYSVKTK